MWKKINRNNNYSINEVGDVRNDTSGRIKKPFVNKKNNYLIVDLYMNNKSKKVPIHRLVAEAFILNPENKLTVDHIDRNRRNNSIENLRWATYSEQNSCFGTYGVRSEKIEVIQYEEERKKRGGGHISWKRIIGKLQFESITDASKHFGCSVSNISQMLEKGTIGIRGITRGYKFYYKNGKRVIHESVTTIETK